jgi:hypothetical protein
MPTDSTVVSTEVLFTRDVDAMSRIDSLESALQALADAGVVVADTADFGDGFELLKDKDLLLNVPFVVVGYKFAPGDFGDQFVVCHLVTETGKKYIITDGSTGVRAQCELYASKGAQAFKARRGLLRSDFRHINGTVLKVSDPLYNSKESEPAKTYYFA